MKDGSASALQGQVMGQNVIKNEGSPFWHISSCLLNTTYGPSWREQGVSLNYILRRLCCLQQAVEYFCDILNYLLIN